MNDIPKSLQSTPILEAVVDIRFKNDLSSAVIFGKLYAALAEEFPETESLPQFDAPPELSDKQPELLFVPHYRLKNDKFVVGIGKRLLSINRICIEEPYKDWQEYAQVIRKVYTEFENLNLITAAERVSIRYMNYFESAAKDVFNLELSFFGAKVDQYEELTLTFIKKLEEDRKLKATISTKAKIEAENFKREGLVANFEAFTDESTETKDILAKVDMLHDDVKGSFFASLNAAFLAELEPVYE